MGDSSPILFAAIRQQSTETSSGAWSAGDTATGCSSQSSQGWARWHRGCFYCAGHTESEVPLDPRTQSEKQLWVEEIQGENLKAEGS